MPFAARSARSPSSPIEKPEIVALPVSVTYAKRPFPVVTTQQAAVLVVATEGSRTADRDRRKRQSWHSQRRRRLH
jgi:hypothetical protein